ncbi:hypothetical protein [uncultured Chitinophaga sp.]|uniref:SecDF P1 head subdomain-containing protein n=1 Tax=uncultured Chitinophaga sp. TaxID=339340 RepID=UPI0025FD88D8|nr:hypothetical protein [uncultured Chitinophaga sp.]
MNRILITLFCMLGAWQLHAQTVKPLTSGIYRIVPKGTNAYKDQSTNETYYLSAAGAVTVKDMKSIATGIASNGYAELTIQLNEAGKLLFSKLTQKNVGKKLAVLVNGKVVMAPQVMSPITGGSLSVSGSFSFAEVDAMKKGLDKEMKSAQKK